MATDPTKDSPRPTNEPFHNNKNKILELIKKIQQNTVFICSIIKLYMNIYIMRMINYVLKSLGYTRIYDLDTGDDLTIFYHVIKLLPILRLPCTFDITYQRLGICTYINEKYVRYVCYNTKLLSVIKMQNDLSSKHYHSIKKIELIPLMQDTGDTLADSVKHIDMTAAKNQLYDVGTFTRPNDVIRFYQIMNNVFGTYDTYDKYTRDNIKSILIHREHFDDDLVEFIESCEEVYVETNC